MQNYNQLRKELNKLCKELNNEYLINYGGCCFVAFVIATHLYKLGIPYKFVICDSIKKCRKDILHELTNQVNNAYWEKDSATGSESCNHYCLQIGTSYINGSYYVNNNYYHKYSFKNIVPDVIKWVYDTSDWNPNYCTKYNDEIIQIINKFFKEYETI